MRYRFHAFDKEGMGLRKFGKIVFIFLNERMEGGKVAKIVAKALHGQRYPMPLLPEDLSIATSLN